MESKTYAKNPAPVPANSPWPVIAIVFGIIFTAYGVYHLYQIVKVILMILDLGGGFFLRYIISANPSIFTAFLFIIGGVGLLARQNWGWVMAMGASMFAVAVTFQILIMAGGEGLAFSSQLMSSLEFWISGLTLFAQAAFIIAFFLPEARRALSVTPTAMIFPFVILGVLLLDWNVMWFGFRNIF